MKPPRLVLDTDMLLSALLFRAGSLSWLRRAWQSEAMSVAIGGHSPARQPRYGGRVDPCVGIPQVPPCRRGPRRTVGGLSALVRDGDSIEATRASGLPRPFRPPLPGIGSCRQGGFVGHGGSRPLGAGNAIPNPNHHPRGFEGPIAFVRAK